MQGSDEAWTLSAPEPLGHSGLCHPRCLHLRSSPRHVCIHLTSLDDAFLNSQLSSNRPHHATSAAIHGVLMHSALNTQDRARAGGLRTGADGSAPGLRPASNPSLAHSSSQAAEAAAAQPLGRTTTPRAPTPCDAPRHPAAAAGRTRRSEGNRAVSACRRKSGADMTWV